MPDTRIPKQCLLQMTRALNENRQHYNMPFWVQSIKDCLIKYSFDDIWNNQGTHNETVFLKELKTKLINKFILSWQQKLNESERFTFYRSFKHSLKVEQYLNDITIKRFRDVLLRFRFGVNELKCNRLFNDIDNDRNCPFCPTALENETHVVFICPMYKELRNKYLTIAFEGKRNYSVPNFLSNASTDFLRKLAMYLYYTLKLREENIK